jgi:outer membrane protein OmpA-like peptidoglycan-associated protein
VVKSPASVPPSTPGRLGIAKTPGGSIIASGDIPADADRAAVLEAFLAADPSAAIVDRLVVRDEGLDANWLERAIAGAKGLSGLDWGNLSLEGENSYLSGSAPQDAIAGVTTALGDRFEAAITPRPDNPDAGLLADLEARASALAAELAAAKARVTDLENASQGTRDERDAAQKRIEAIAAELEAAKAAGANLDKASGALKADLEAARKRIEEITAELAAAKTACADLEKASGALKADLEAARKRIGELTAQLAAHPAPPAAAAAAPSATDVARSCNEAIAGLLRGASIQFQTGSATITNYGLGVIDRIMLVAKPCLDLPGLKVAIGGHTDDIGDDVKNLQLSQARANAVRAALVERGIKEEIITALGFGERQPIADNSTDAGRQENRRITMEWSLP